MLIFIIFSTATTVAQGGVGDSSGGGGVGGVSTTTDGDGNEAPSPDMPSPSLGNSTTMPAISTTTLSIKPSSTTNNFGATQATDPPQRPTPTDPIRGDDGGEANGGNGEEANGGNGQETNGDSGQEVAAETTGNLNCFMFFF